MKLTVAQVTHATERARHEKNRIVRLALRMLEDPEEHHRHRECKCVTCYYTGARMAGQAFTAWTCLSCEEPQPLWPNTAIPKICFSCAKKYSLCTDCVADLDLRTRLKVSRLIRGAAKK